MIKRTYKVFEESDDLIREELFENNLLIKMVDYAKESRSTMTFSYNASGLLLSETEASGGITLNSTTLKYDEANRIIENSFYIGEALFEQTTTQYSEQKSIQKIYQEGELIEKLEQAIDNTKWRRESYEDNELSQVATYIFDNKTNEGTIKKYDRQGNLLEISKEIMNAFGHAVIVEEYNEINQLTHRSKYEYDKLKIIKSTHESPLLSDEQNTSIYEYDLNDNLLSIITKTGTNNLVGVQNYIYDNLNRVIEEAHLVNGLKEHYRYVYSE